jgi:AcrR family transcriptional regulator
MEPRGRREEYSEATRQALLEAAREAFARDGYQAAGIERISRASRVTRGAFYHHFEDKKALFDALVVAMQKDAATRIAERARSQKRVWDRLGAGIEAYLDACSEPAFARIVVQEAPVVLGAQRYREIEDATTYALLIATLRALHQRGEIKVDDIELLGRMVDAMVCEIALMLPHAKEPKALRKRGQRMVTALLESFRRS